MDKLDRVMTLYRELNNRRYPVSRQQLEQKLECKGVTVKRAIGTLRDYFGVPVIYLRDQNGYVIDRAAGEHEIPGLWLNPEEIHALLVADSLLSNLEPGLVRAETGPFRQRLRNLMARIGGGEQHFDRIRLLSMGRRREQSRWFPRIAQAVLQRQRLRIGYHARSDDSASQREVSPQRLTHYRDNWYLDAWCHQREDLRTFSLDCIETAETLDRPALDMDNETLDRHYATAYGIFAGEPDKVAVLHFTAHRARWVANEIWHPQQTGYQLADGCYELRLPYRRHEELLGDILKYGADVEVMEPPSLREAVRRELERMTKKHEKSSHRISD
ncbi:MAG: transcriptional regulator [Gammaproteobacteria bacterium]|nr:MAG: transcriptional regulator [Gammaproteobacteria bacterium]